MSVVCFVPLDAWPYFRLGTVFRCVWMRKFLWVVVIGGRRGHQLMFSRQNVTVIKVRLDRFFSMIFDMESRSFKPE